MNGVSLFSGVGGLDLGAERAGVRVVAQCEADPWRRRVLKRHWPGVPCFEDVRDAAGQHEGQRVELVFGGSPCQGLSVAGQRRMLADDRSGLYYEFARVADELVRPGGWLLFENVPGLLSGCSCQGCRDCGELLRLHSRGWSLLGGDARRDDGDRLFADGEAERPDGTKRAGRCPCRRCDEARRLLAAHSGTEFAVVRGILGNLGFHDLAWRVLDSRYFGVPQRRRRVFVLARRARGRRACEVLLEPEGGGGDFEAGTEARKGIAPGAEVSSLRSSDGRRAGQPPDESAAASLVVNALDRKGGGADDNDASGGHLVAGTVRSRVRPGSNDVGGIVAVAAPLTKGSATGEGVSVPGRRQEDDQNLVVGLTRRTGKGPNTTLDDGALVISAETDADRVREAAGLPGRVDVDAEPSDRCALDPLPDGPRYAACGDAVTVNVAEWIFKRLLQYEQEQAVSGSLLEVIG